MRMGRGRAGRGWAWGGAHLMARYMGRMAKRGKVWTLIMMVMKAMYSRTLMKPAGEGSRHAGASRGPGARGRLYL